MKTLFHLLILSIFMISVLAAEEPQYEKFGMDRLTQKQLEKDTDSALTGDMKAALRVGRHYMGLKSYQDGIRWLRISAALGDPSAQTDFFVYASGLDGDALLLLEGKIWLRKACDAGHKHALFVRDATIKYSGKAKVEFK